jgi:methionyl aminopeptidase
MLIKSKKDIKNLRENCQRMGVILDDLAKLVIPGVSTAEIDRAFKGYRTIGTPTPFPATVCISLNEEVVHGIPREDRIIAEGDLVTLDIGMEWPAPKRIGKSTRIQRGTFSDTALTIAVGPMKPETKKLLDVTREALEAGIRAAQPGASIASIGKAIEGYVKSQGTYGIVRDLVGHGVGHAVHEEPYIPNYYDPALEDDFLQPGMVIALEPMIALGNWKVETMPDHWTIRMADKSLSAHFEHTIIIEEKGNYVATRRPSESSRSKDVARHDFEQIV